MDKEMEIYKWAEKENIAFKVRVDFREESSYIWKILETKYNISVVVEALGTGDYIIDDEIIVERKTTRDFAMSIIDGRLFRQTLRMKKLFDSYLIIIEGKDLYNTGIDINPNAIKGALTSLAVCWQIPVLFSDDSEETAFLIWESGKQNVFRKEFSFRPGRRPKRENKQKLYILQGLPSVGPKSAEKLLMQFGSIEKVINAPEEELMKIEGFGKVKVQKIKNILKEQKEYYAERRGFLQ